MTRDEFIEEFAGIVGAEPEDLAPDTNLKEETAWDSVAYLSAMVLIDEGFGIAVPGKALAEAVSFRDILALVDEFFDE